LLGPDLKDFLANFESGTHAILFYDSLESKRELLFNHLKLGQDRQSLAYVCSEESPEQIRKAMIDFGLDAGSIKGNRRITIANYDEVYIVNREVRIPEIIGKFSGMVDSSRAKGYSGLRAGAEMSCFFRQNMIQELLDYERALHVKFSFSAMGICAFTVMALLRSGHMDVFMKLVKTHDPIIYSTPNGFLLLKPQKVKPTDLETVMHVTVR
jgi:hypothetical protein